MEKVNLALISGPPSYGQVVEHPPAYEDLTNLYVAVPAVHGQAPAKKEEEENKEPENDAKV